MKHTPGPWYQRECVIYADNYDRSFIIAECRDSILNANDYESNANLIAAAPDLLQALEEMILEFSSPEYDLICDHSVGICSCTPLNIIEKAKSAIKKAKGL